jgi:hypothetical protein
MKKFSLKSVFLALLAVSMLGFNSCKPEEKDPVGFTVTAQVKDGVNLNSQISDVKAILSSATVTGEEIASGEYKNGGFTITLPLTVKSELLSVISFTEDEEEEDIDLPIIISDPTAKMARLDFYAYKDGSAVGVFDYSSSDLTSLSGSHGLYMYVDKNTNVTGTIISEIVISEDAGSPIPLNITINMDLKAGWNTIYTTLLFNILTPSAQGSMTTTKPDLTFEWIYSNNVSPAPDRKALKSFFK